METTENDAHVIMIWHKFFKKIGYYEDWSPTVQRSKIEKADLKSYYISSGEKELGTVMNIMLETLKNCQVLDVIWMWIVRIG